MNLKVNHVSVSFQNTSILNDISFEAKKGEFIGLIGPNGAGKTTLLRTIMNFVACSGEVAIDGEAVAGMGHQQRARCLSYLPQERDVAWPVSVEMVVGLGRHMQRSAFASLSDADRIIINQAMLQMDVAQFAQKSVMDLSGGEKARVMIARLLAQGSPFILADEPVSGLDPAHQLNLMQYFSDLAQSGKTVIASLHDLSLSAQRCTRLILLEKGKIIADGKPEEVLTLENLRQVYKIEADITHKNGRLYIQPESVVKS
ncbi:ABC transporter ATP-binding protein [Brucellaceae bacterium C25G]